MSGTPREVKPFRREIELDFIRGVAILLVVDFHMPTSLLLAPFTRLGIPHFGWAGVDVFFVLSGFLVGGLLIKEWQLKSRIDSKRFLVRRAFKIWPQYYFFLLVMLLSGHRTMRTLWGNFFNIQNYTGGVAHTWTLALEEHAYLLLLLLLAFAARRQMRMRTLFLVVGLVACCVPVWRTILLARSTNVFTRTDTRIDGILYGVLLAMMYHYRPDIFRRVQRWTALWVLVVAVAVLDFCLHLHYWWRADLEWFLADMMGVALLLLLYRHRVDRQRPMWYRAIAWIGLYSYGIYLWHVSVVDPVGSLSRHLHGAAASVVAAVGQPVCGIVLGIATTKLIEFPALALRDRLFPRPVDAATGVPAEVEKARHLHPPKEALYSEPR